VGLSEEVNVMAEKENIEIPKNLYLKIAEKVKGSEFSTVSDYVVFVLTELINEEEGEGRKISKEDEDKVRERLRSLGYTD
jgi:Arc/MetJ-type ribon-helix-helix transcriptional regulator